MRDGRNLKEMEEGIRLAVARIGLPLDTPEFNEAIRQLAEALAPKGKGLPPVDVDVDMDGTGESPPSDK